MFAIFIVVGILYCKLVEKRTLKSLGFNKKVSDYVLGMVIGSIFELNISRQTISKWESSDSTPDMEKLKLLSELFAISLDELVLGKAPASTKKSTADSEFITMVEEKVLTKNNLFFVIRSTNFLAFTYLQKFYILSATGSSE